MPEARRLDIDLSNFDITSLWVILGISIVALGFAVYIVRNVLRQDEGTPAMREIAKAIQEGAAAYLGRQFATLRLFVVLLTLVLLALPAPDWGIRIARSVAFVVGAGFSAITGYVGMSLAVRANVRMAAAARESYRKAFTIAFRSGGVAGMFTVGLGLLGATAIFGILTVRPRSETEPGMRAINRGFFLSALLSAVAVFLVAQTYVDDLRVAWAVIIGLVLSSAIQLLTEHYTSTRRKPVQEIAGATRTGPATTILSGFSVGLESTVYAIVVVGAAIAGAYLLGEGDISFALYSIALTGMGMLTTVGVIVSMDTFGPIADNAQGIAQMSGGLGAKADESIEALDAVGNTTKAITKGMAIATAVIAATSLFGSFRDTVVELTEKAFTVPIENPLVLVGLLIGGAVPFMFSSLTIRAVERAASRVVQEVRRQFRERPGIMKRTETPEYGRVVSIVTADSLRELTTPGLLAILTPVAVGFALGIAPLGAYLAGVILTGQLLAVLLSNAGGAWDNAKKLIEEGLYGGKGSEAHKAGVIGDTVGDPFKDTAGPALNPLMKVMNLVALLVVPSVVKYSTGADKSDAV